MTGRFRGEIQTPAARLASGWWSDRTVRGERTSQRSKGEVEDRGLSDGRFAEHEDADPFRTGFLYSGRSVMHRAGDGPGRRASTPRAVLGPPCSVV